MNSVTSNNISSKSKRFAPLNCKYIGIRKLEFGGKTQFLYVRDSPNLSAEDPN